MTIGKIGGIITCAHVAEGYRKRTEIGLLRFSRENIRQMQKLDLGNTHTVYIEENIGEPPWSNPEAFDLAFTRLPEDVVATLQATSTFLNWDSNMAKLAGGEPKYDRHVDAVFGLVHERSGEPVREHGLVTTPMECVLTPGHVIARRNGVMTLQCINDASKLPKSFGGTSGGGLWRTYIVDEPGGSYRALDTRLVGIASFQTDATHIVCQAMERIEQSLVPAVRENLGG